jgi:hypothetical protein
MLDPVVKALLLRLAEDLDAEVLGPLADALEEAGDVRAGKVRQCVARESVRHDRQGRPVAVWVADAPTERMTFDTPDLARAQAARYALSLFPEGPRWQVCIRQATLDTPDEDLPRARLGYESPADFLDPWSATARRDWFATEEGFLALQGHDCIPNDLDFSAAGSRYYAYVPKIPLWSTPAAG